MLLMALWNESWSLLADWSMSDTWVVVTAVLAAMSCAVPGNFLVLRRQSMMGDALSHSVLPGVAGAFLLAHYLMTSGMITPGAYHAWWHAAMFAGAVLTGVMTAVLTEMVRRLGGVESSAALGVVFTSLFALGLLMIRLFADGVHLDPDCVLYGQIETVGLGVRGIPQPVMVNGGVFLFNLLLLVVCYKELKISTFDPQLATTVGINAHVMQYGLMAVTAVTLVAAFESVGSILVIAMLIAPAVTARLMTDRLSAMLLWSLAVAAASAVLGHTLAIVLPPLIFHPLGFDMVHAASTSGMMAVAAGGLFTLALFFSPRYGLLSRWLRRYLLSWKMAAEDVLGLLFRLEESQQTATRADMLQLFAELDRWSTWRLPLLYWKLQRNGQMVSNNQTFQLTDQGRHTAQNLVRSHRLWETYLEQHFSLTGPRQHSLAHRLEHFAGENLREALSDELGQPHIDPHGRHIPPPLDTPPT